ncbi:MAG: TlpA disulfide reductase family protein [Algibacter sp.]
MNKLIILLGTLVITSCNANLSKNYILFSGKISNPTSEKFELVYKEGNGRFAVNIAEDGSFTLDTITSGTGIYRLEGLAMNRMYIYLANGGEYNLTFDEKKMIKTSVLTGPMPNPSTYLRTKNAVRDSLRGMSFGKYKTLEPAEFLTTSNKIKDNLTKYLKSFPDMPKDFFEYELGEINNYYHLYLIRYEYLHGQITGQIDTFRVSDEFFEDLEGVDFINESAYKYGGYYKTLVKEYFELKAKKISEKSGDNYFLTKLNVFGAVPNEYIKNQLLAISAKNDLSEIPNLEEYYDTFLSVSTSKKNNENVTKRYKELKKVADGAPSPIFKNYINYASGTNSLADFKGKYVYIDVWATWCSPCLKEAPYLKKVEKKYHGKNIEFVSISIDRKNMEDAWRKKIKSKELSGVQLLADADWQSEFVKSYQIKGIPRFILIDPDGNIVSRKAPRPSSPELITLLNDLII